MRVGGWEQVELEEGGWLVDGAKRQAWAVLTSPELSYLMLFT